MGAPRFVLDRFWPSNLFLGGIPGAWYDPTDLSTMFQDSTGYTPVTAVEQPVGLILDKSQGLVQGSQLVVNGDGTTLTGWTTADDAGCSSSVSGGQFVLATVAGGAARLRQTIPTTAGKTYVVSISCNTSASNATAAFTVWGAAYGITTLFSAQAVANGVVTAIVQATSANIYLQLSAFSGSTGLTNYYDNVSVRELAGNHASQSTAASRPTYRARYNLLTYSEDFGNAYWSKFQSSVTQDTTTAPDGTTTADKLVENAVNNAHAVDSSSVTVVGTTFTFSVYLKADQRSFVRAECIQLAPSVVSRSAVVNLSNGALTSVDPAITATTTSVGNGWYRCVFTTTYASATSVRLTLAMGTSASTFSYLGDGTSGLFLWGAQLLTAADVTATSNAYQRIAAATVYDTAPIFRPYLAFDGMDDSLATAAINFTATDKMTVFAGATKSSDATLGVLAELSVLTASNNGSFGIFYPLNTSTATSTIFFRGTADSQLNYTSAAPITSVTSFAMNLAGATRATALQVRQNATAAIDAGGGINAAPGGGNFGNFPLFIGRRNNASLPFNGRIYELIVRGAASSTTEIIDTETWVNARTGGY